LTRLFVPVVKASIGIVVAFAAAACNLHHVAVVHEVRREREAVCAAKPEAVRARNAFIGTLDEAAADKCVALTRLTGNRT
jgi:hypothetical protein